VGAAVVAECGGGGAAVDAEHVALVARGARVRGAGQEEAGAQERLQPPRHARRPRPRRGRGPLVRLRRRRRRHPPHHHPRRRSAAGQCRASPTRWTAQCRAAERGRRKEKFGERKEKRSRESGVWCLGLVASPCLALPLGGVLIVARCLLRSLSPSRAVRLLHRPVCLSLLLLPARS
jgi:hypothetical protein